MLVTLRAAVPGAEPVAVVSLAHGRCLRPAVRYKPGGIEPPPAAGMSATAVVLPHVGGPRPLIVTEAAARVVAVLGGGERRDAATAALLGDGLHLLGDAWQPAPPAAGWEVRLTGPGTVLVIDPHGGAYYDGELEQPATWRAAVAARGAVELLAGTDGIGAGGPGNPEPGVLALESAARAGRLVGATITARHDRRRWRDRPA